MNIMGLCRLVWNQSPQNFRIRLIVVLRKLTEKHFLYCTVFYYLILNLKAFTFVIHCFHFQT